MYKYHNLNPISQVGLDEFTKDYAPVSTPKTADAILVRSAAMHEMEFATDLKAIARAGAGVNNIPLEKCAEQGIVVFDEIDKKGKKIRVSKKSNSNLD